LFVAGEKVAVKGCNKELAVLGIMKWKSNHVTAPNFMDAFILIL
jgi:hypothetical protein